MVVIDTDVLIEISKGNRAIIEKTVKLEVVEQLSTTILNAEEFLFGLHAFDKKEEKTMQGRELLKRLKIYNYTEKELPIIVNLKVKLKKHGKTIGKYDECIAGICIAKNEPLFTLNKKHFERIEGLRLV